MKRAMAAVQRVVGAHDCAGRDLLVGTGMEWDKLIAQDHLTISTNLFGTTFYSLVGLHASHVIVGLIMLTIVLIFALTGALKPSTPNRWRCWRCTGILWMRCGWWSSPWCT